MNMYFTLLLVIIVIAFLLTNRKEEKKIVNNENLRNNQSHKNLQVALDNYNKRLSKIEVNKIDKHLSFTTGSITQNIKDKVMPIINKLLDEINSVSNLRLKFAELVRIEHLMDNSGNSQFLVQMFIVRINEHATSKLILNVYRSKSGMININSIKLEKDSFKERTGNTAFDNHFLPADSLQQYKNTGESRNVRNYVNYGAIHDRFSFETVKKPEQVDIQEPCLYNIPMWDKNGVNKTMRARKNCSINNNSQQKPAVHLYNNPTLFSHSFVNPDNYI